MGFAPPRGASLPFVLAIVVRVARNVRHDDLTSSPPSSVLSTAVRPECSFVATDHGRVALVAGT